MNARMANHPSNMLESNGVEQAMPASSQAEQSNKPMSPYYLDGLRVRMHPNAELPESMSQEMDASMQDTMNESSSNAQRHSMQSNDDAMMQTRQSAVNSPSAASMTMSSPNSMNGLLSRAAAGMPSQVPMLNMPAMSPSMQAVTSPLATRPAAHRMSISMQHQEEGNGQVMYGEEDTQLQDDLQADWLPNEEQMQEQEMMNMSPMARLQAMRSMTSSPRTPSDKMASANRIMPGQSACASPSMPVLMSPTQLDELLPRLESMPPCSMDATMHARSLDQIIQSIEDIAAKLAGQYRRACMQRCFKLTLDILPSISALSVATSSLSDSTDDMTASTATGKPEKTQKGKKNKNQSTVAVSPKEMPVHVLKYQHDVMIPAQQTALGCTSMDDTKIRPARLLAKVIRAELRNLKACGLVGMQEGSYLNAHISMQQGQQQQQQQYFECSSLPITSGQVSASLSNSQAPGPIVSFYDSEFQMALSVPVGGAAGSSSKSSEAKIPLSIMVSLQDGVSSANGSSGSADMAGMPRSSSTSSFKSSFKELFKSSKSKLSSSSKSSSGMSGSMSNIASASSSKKSGSSKGLLTFGSRSTIMPATPSSMMFPGQGGDMSASSIFCSSEYADNSSRSSSNDKKKQKQQQQQFNAECSMATQMPLVAGVMIGKTDFDLGSATFTDCLSGERIMEFDVRFDGNSSLVKSLRLQCICVPGGTGQQDGCTQSEQQSQDATDMMTEQSKQGMSAMMTEQSKQGMSAMMTVFVGRDRDTDIMDLPNSLQQCRMWLERRNANRKAFVSLPVPHAGVFSLRASDEPNQWMMYRGSLRTSMDASTVYLDLLPVIPATAAATSKANTRKITMRLAGVKAIMASAASEVSPTCLRLCFPSTVKVNGKNVGCWYELCSGSQEVKNHWLSNLKTINHVKA